jgi:DNA repair exonuclease SbcCD ATPase subunit
MSSCASSSAHQPHAAAGATGADGRCAGAGKAPAGPARRPACDRCGSVSRSKPRVWRKPAANYEVNTRLQAKTALRARIRNTALRTHEQLQTELTALAQWLAEHERYRLWGQEIAGWRAQFSQLNRDKTQLLAAARIIELRNKLAAMPENALTLTADEVSAAMEQQSRSRTLRQRLTSLHARYQPLQKRLRQS